MDYEKKYKEALERAKDMLFYKEDMEYLFPELKETEDERIRKELITNCRNIRCVTEEGAERIAKWIAWLEKQDKNEEINEMSYRTGIKRVLDNPESYGLEKQGTDISSFPKEQQMFMQNYVSLDKITLVKLLAERDANNAEIIESFEKQDEQNLIMAKSPQLGEQKSVWGEEDEEMVNNIIDYIKPMPIFFESTKGKSGKEYTKEFIKNATKWLKSLKDKEQPKQEWSQEDEQYLLVCKNALAKYQITDKWDAHIISRWLENKLKSLR